MTRRWGYKFWTGSILAVVCLLLLSVLVRDYRQARKVVIRGQTQSISFTKRVKTVYPQPQAPKRAESRADSIPGKKNRPQPLLGFQPEIETARPALPSKQPTPNDVLTTAGPLAVVQPQPQPQPKTVTLEPLGYVEKANGQIEAVISMGEHVQVVHEGESFDDKFRVAKISSSAVELVENSGPAPAPEAHLTADVGQGAVLASPSLGGARLTNVPPVPEQVSNSDLRREFDAANTVISLQYSVHQKTKHKEGPLAVAPPRTKAVALEPLGRDDAKVSTSQLGPLSTITHLESPLETERRLEPQLPAARPPAVSEQARLTDVLPKASSLPVAPPQPKTVTLEPLGYVEKADGRVEAIVSVGEHVQVLHEGESFDDNLTVAKISSSAVELVENSGPTSETRLTAQPGQGAGPASPSPGTALQANIPSAPRQVSNSAGGGQFDAANTVNRLEPIVHQQIGYVERADGHVEAIVAEGELVRLNQATKSFENEFHGQAASPGNIEVANALLPATAPTDLFRLDSRPVQPSSSDQDAEAEPQARAAPEFGVSRATGPPESIATNVDSPEQIGVMDPEPVADYVGGEMEPKPPPTVASTVSPAQQPVPKIDAEPAATSFKTVGYVEKAGGEKEAIVEVAGQIYLVHEGEVFAGKFRALRITPFSVQIGEESARGSTAPTESDLNQPTTHSCGSSQEGDLSVGEMAPSGRSIVSGYLVVGPCNASPPN